VQFLWKRKFLKTEREDKINWYTIANWRKLDEAINWGPRECEVNKKCRKLNCTSKTLGHYFLFPYIISSWMSPVNSLSSRVQTFVDVSSLISLDVQNSSSNQLLYIYEELRKLQSLWIKCGSDVQLSGDTTSILDALYATNLDETESSGTASQMQNVFTLIECNSRSKLFEKTLLIRMGTSLEITYSETENFKGSFLIFLS